MKYGLLGEKLGHSYSKVIHNQLGNANYELIEVSIAELDKLLSDKKFNGLNVTIPYKQEVMKYCDSISDRAIKIGSVNTIVNNNGKLIGDNTDYYGFDFMAKKANISFENKKIIILGSGGTSLTAIAVVNDNSPKEVVVVSRNGENNYENISKHYDADIIINTTPVGMSPNMGESPVDLSNFTNLSDVIDVIYNPYRTALLVQAKNLGINYINGLAMLVAQAVKADSIFFDKTIDMDDAQSCIDKVTNILEREFCNIVLVGMPGCGKSSTAKVIAKQLNLPYIDTDKLIVERTNMSIKDIFDTHGEPYFRQVEADIIKEQTKTTGKIIATGGGAILNSDSCNNILATSKVFWLSRDVNKLSTDGRPLSTDIETIKKLAEQRYPIYSMIADYHIEALADSDQYSDKILKLL